MTVEGTTIPIYTAFNWGPRSGTPVGMLCRAGFGAPKGSVGDILMVVRLMKCVRLFSLVCAIYAASCCRFGFRQKLRGSSSHMQGRLKYINESSLSRSSECLLARRWQQGLSSTLRCPEMCSSKVRKRKNNNAFSPLNNFWRSPAGGLVSLSQRTWMIH